MYAYSLTELAFGSCSPTSARNVEFEVPLIVVNPRVTFDEVSLGAASLAFAAEELVAPPKPGLCLFDEFWGAPPKRLAEPPKPKVLLGWAKEEEEAAWADPAFAPPVSLLQSILAWNMLEELFIALWLFFWGVPAFWLPGELFEFAETAAA